MLMEKENQEPVLKKNTKMKLTGRGSFIYSKQDTLTFEH